MSKIIGIHYVRRKNAGAISEKAIQPYMLLLKPDKMAIIVLHELTHILMQSPAGNAYTFCCENVGKIIKVGDGIYMYVTGRQKLSPKSRMIASERQRKENISQLPPLTAMTWYV